MSRFYTAVFGVVFAGLSLGNLAHGQAPPPTVAPSSAMGATAPAAPSPDSNSSSSSSSSEVATPASPSAANSSSEMAPSATIEPGTNVADTTTEVPDAAVNPASLLPLPPALSRTKVSLIGGTVYKLDRIRDQFTLQIFGGGKMKIYFDPRTHIYKDGVEASVADLRRGDRVSIDTILDGSTVFARTIRLKGAAGGEGQGIVVSYREDKGELQIRDALSPVPLKLHLTNKTRVTDHGKPASASALMRGTLVSVTFGSAKDGRAVADEILVLATPGASFTFVGQISALDLSTGLLVLTSATDGKTYEIYLDPSLSGDNLRQAAEVTVHTRFDGSRYVAQNLTVN
jgi:hypothetical protein